MKTETKILLAVLVLTVLLLVGGVFFLSSKQPQGATTDDGKTVYEIDYSKGQKLGSDSAKVKLVEFGDLQCPACKAYEPTLNSIRSKNQNNPNFQFIYRHFPLYPTPHKYAKIAAEVVEEAATQGKFWQMHDNIYATQLEWATKGSDKEVTDFFVNLGIEQGLDGIKIQEAVKNNTYDDKIKADTDEGNKVGVNSTPTFFLNGRRLILNNLNDLETEVDNALK